MQNTPKDFVSNIALLKDTLENANEKLKASAQQWKIQAR